ELEDAAAQLRVGDAEISAHQFKSFTPHDRLVTVKHSGGFAQTLGRLGRPIGVDLRAVGNIQIFEKERHRDIEHLRQLVQPAGTDAVGAALVFLYLLEGEADGLAEFLLAHAEQRAAQPNPCTDMHIDRIWVSGFVAAATAPAGVRCHRRLCAVPEHQRVITCTGMRSTDPPMMPDAVRAQRGSRKRCRSIAVAPATTAKPMSSRTANPASPMRA